MESIVFNNNVTQPFANYRRVASDITGKYIAVSFTNIGGIYLSGDYGKSFVKTNFPNVLYNILPFFVSSDGLKIYAFIVNQGPTYPNAIYYSSDGGTSYLSTSQSIYYLQYFVDEIGNNMIVSNNLYTGQGDGNTYTSTSGPGNLRLTNIPITNNCVGVSYGSNGTFVACISDNGSGNGGIYYSTNGLNFSVVFGASKTFISMSGNSTGQYLCATDGTSIYYSTTFGSMWATSTLPSGTPSLTNFTCSRNGEFFYCQNTQKQIYRSTNYGITWGLSTFVQPNGISGPTILICDLTGNYIVFYINGLLYTSLDYGINFTKNSLSISSNSSPTIVRTSSPNIFIMAQNTNNTNTYLLFGNIILTPIVCFNKDTKILTDKGYRSIQDLRKGDLIKTLNDGYKNIEMIAKKEIHHPALQNRVKDQLYKYSKNIFEHVFEDLIITGSHSVLVDDFSSQEEKEKTREILGDIYITDNKYRLPACIDKKSEVLETPGTYTIYHFALENENYYFNYGIYANGLLVETCSKRYLKELSDMELLE